MHVQKNLKATIFIHLCAKLSARCFMFQLYKRKALQLLKNMNTVQQIETKLTQAIIISFSIQPGEIILQEDTQYSISPLNNMFKIFFY